MAITIADVEHVALLSRLEISAEEKERFAQELSDIFGHVEELNKVDVSGVPPTAHPLPSPGATARSPSANAIRGRVSAR